MSMFTKASCTALVACCLTVGTVGAQAALVNFTLTGEVNSRAEAGNVFGANLHDIVTVTGTFDDSVLSSGTGTVSFTQGTGNILSFGFAGVSFTEQSDSNYTVADSYPSLTFSGGTFTGFNFVAMFGEGSHEFNSSGLYLDGYEDGWDKTVSGTWLGLETTPVPVPAAVWLLGSGLLGLVGVTRRRRTV